VGRRGTHDDIATTATVATVGGFRSFGGQKGVGEASFATVAGTQHHSTFVDKFALCGFTGKVFAVGQKVPFRQGVSHSF
jgi:hypothetical protein